MAKKQEAAGPKEGDLKVWHIPQVPGKPFEVPVRSVIEGKLILATLAQYDLFQLANNIKPDFCNAAGLCVFEDGEWVDWMDDEGNSVDQSIPLCDAVKEQKTSALLVVHQDAKIKAFLEEHDPKALQQIESAITSEMQYREALWAGKVVSSHATAAAKKVENDERPYRRSRN